jgi:hypothetical protein
VAWQKGGWRAALLCSKTRYLYNLLSLNQWSGLALFLSNETLRPLRRFAFKLKWIEWKFAIISPPPGQTLISGG